MREYNYTTTRKRNSNNKFVVTSHEIDLLDQPLRPDQIWFVNKSFKNESELYSLFDFADFYKKRAEISYAKRYLKGEFGATPIINDYLSERYLHEEEFPKWERANEVQSP